jgi:hypothetical protein
MLCKAAVIGKPEVSTGRTECALTGAAPETDSARPNIFHGNALPYGYVRNAYSEFHDDTGGLMAWNHRTQPGAGLVLAYKTAGIRITLPDLNISRTDARVRYF